MRTCMRACACVCVCAFMSGSMCLFMYARTCLPVCKLLQTHLCTLSLSSLAQPPFARSNTPPLQALRSCLCALVQSLASPYTPTLHFLSCSHSQPPTPPCTRCCVAVLKGTSPHSLTIVQLRSVPSHPPFTHTPRCVAALKGDYPTHS